MLYPAELRTHMEFLVPLADELRTLRRRSLYPAELQGHEENSRFILPVFPGAVNPKSVKETRRRTGKGFKASQW